MNLNSLDHAQGLCHTRHIGRVDGLKETYGFLNEWLVGGTRVKDIRIFFKFKGLKDVTALRPGDFVSFHRVKDVRQNCLKALFVTRLAGCPQAYR